MRLAAALREAEEELAGRCEALGIAWTLFRPTLIYGGPGSAVCLIARVARRLRCFPVAGRGAGLRQPVHAEDLAAACLLALDRPACHGRAYDLGGGETLTYREMVERVFLHVGRRPVVLPVPLPLLRAAIAVARILPRFRGLSPAMAERSERDQAFDITDAKRDFGYQARPFLAEGPDGRRKKGFAQGEPTEGRLA